jgi:hypothetical protein
MDNRAVSRALKRARGVIVAVVLGVTLIGVTPDVDAAGHRITMCHRPPGNPGNHRTIAVGSEAAARDHESHGDFRGSCEGDDDRDGVRNATDNCRTTPNPDQQDADGDGLGDACEDDDGDGVINASDNCPTTPNAEQTDTDGDGDGDACDATPNGDSDGDGVDNNADNCPADANPNQEDTDDDGVGDACDLGLGVGELTVTMQWDNLNDMDLHVTQPNGFRIFFGAPHDPATGGTLDQDSNIGCVDQDEVENIFWPSGDGRDPAVGRYTVRADEFRDCDGDSSWTITVRRDGAPVLVRSGVGPGEFQFDLAADGTVTPTS